VLMLMLMLVIEIPLANAQRSTPNVQRPIEEDRRRRAEGRSQRTVKESEM
jgi:hypothetical protein